MPHPKLRLLHILILLMWSSQASYGQKTIITGKAVNAKYSAAVLTSGGDMYYIDGLKAWSPDLFEKPIKVTGKLIIKKNVKEPEEISGRITSPTIKIIKRARVETLSDSTAFLYAFQFKTEWKL